MFNTFHFLTFLCYTRFSFHFLAFLTNHTNLLSFSFFWRTEISFPFLYYTLPRIEFFWRTEISYTLPRIENKKKLFTPNVTPNLPKRCVARVFRLLFLLIACSCAARVFRLLFPSILFSFKPNNLWCGDLIHCNGEKPKLQNSKYKTSLLNCKTATSSWKCWTSTL